MSRSSYNRTTTALALISLIAVSALLGLPYWRQDFVLADLSTDNARRYSEYLKDGSLLDLDASSSVALQFDDDQHRIRLLGGQILLQAGATPLQVTTPQAAIETRSNARLIIERLEDTTLVSQLDGSSTVDNHLVLQAGQQVRLRADGVGPVKPVDSAAQKQAWSTGLLLAVDQPLSDVLERLARHHPGLLLFDRDALHARRISARLSLSDTDQALAELARNHPLRIRQITPWLTIVSLTASQ